jgi:phage shock protein PspC (stress-responsive transcriptional regulator)
MPQQTPPPGETGSPETDATTPPFPTPPPPAGNRFFAWMRGLGIPREPGWIGGVCAGIAARLGIDPLIVRGIVVVVAVLGGPALLLYAAAWLLLPDASNKIHLEEVFRGKLEAPIAAIGAIFLFALLPTSQGFWLFDGDGYWGGPSWDGGFGSTIWSLIVVGLIVWLVIWIARRSESHAASSTPSSAFAAAPDTAHSAGVADADTAVYPAGMDTAAPAAPPAPAAGAPAEELAAWREQQALWKAQHTAFRQQQAGVRQAAVRAAQEQARIERNARYAEERAARARTRSHPLYTLSVIGLAVVAGALTLLAVSQGTVSAGDIPLGLAAALGVLALGIIINGVRGKRGGGSTAVAIIIVVILALSALVPRVTDIRIGGDTFYEPVNRAGSGQQTFAVPFGDVTMDLTEYYDGSPLRSDTGGRPDSVLLAVGAADVTVILPADEYVRLDTELGSGEVIKQGPDGTTSYDGISTSVTEYLPSSDEEWNGTDRRLDVQVRLGAGTLTIIESAEGVTE